MKDILPGEVKRIFENSGLMAYVHQIVIFAVGFGDRGFYRDTMTGGIPDHV